MLSLVHRHMAGLKRPYRISIILLFQLLLISTIALMPAIVLAQGGTYTDQPFNGMQIIYNVTGVTVTDTTDTPGFTTSREMAGALGSGTLSVSGTCAITSGYGAHVDISVTAGSKTQSQSLDMTTPATKSFSVSVPIPSDATSGSFSIDETGNYNAGTRDVVVSGSFNKSGTSSKPTTGHSSVANGNPPSKPTKSTNWAVIVPLALLVGVALAVTVSTVAIIAMGPTIFEGDLILELATWLSTNGVTGPVIAFLYNGLSRFTLNGIPVLKLIYNQGPKAAKYALDSYQKTTLQQIKSNPWRKLR